MFAACHLFALKMPRVILTILASEKLSVDSCSSIIGFYATRQI
jgi:hypothetical protein